MKGGARHKQKPTLGQKALLDALWHRYGGVGAVAEMLGVHIQAPVNWRLRGKVPLKLCRLVADKLDLAELQLWGLNYNDMFVFYRTEVPSWKEVVQSFNFPADTEKEILSLKAPKSSSV